MCRKFSRPTFVANRNKFQFADSNPMSINRSAGGAPRPSREPAGNDGGENQNDPFAVTEDVEVRRSKTLKQFGYMSIFAGVITVIATLITFVCYKQVWHTLLGQLFSGMLLLPLGILGIMSGTNVEDQCYVITTNILSAAVACIEAGNVALCGVNFQTDQVVLLAILICFSAIKGALALAMLLKSSRYACHFYNCCHKDEMLTKLI